ncbi:hypothetical protein ACEWY4_017008 [Coilia grayii]|uniref:Ig-like domain-containing protein n=1 Tax=Coilia grayii TaxID=363190 RepID=A0ABD1JND5_9TELE
MPSHTPSHTQNNLSQLKPDFFFSKGRLKMDFHKALVFVWCLCGVGLNASTDSSCHMTLEGQSFAITLGSPKQDGDALVWRCNETVIYERRNGTIKGSAEVDDRGSLSLTNLTTAMSCTYRAEHWSKSAMPLKKTTANVCVVPKAPVPTLVVTCSSSGVGSLYCASGSSKGFTLSWFHNNVELKERVNPFTPTHPGEKDQYKCRLSNDLYLGDTQDSNDVIISCPRPDECTDKLEGSSHTIVLDLPEKSRGSLTWKCNDTTIYPSKTTARVQSTVNVDKKGSLSLTKLTTSVSGTYTAEYRVDKISATKTERLCVLRKYTQMLKML